MRKVVCSLLVGASLTAAALPSDARGGLDPRDAPLLLACGEGDDRLGELAARLARRHLDGRPLPSADELADELRAAGETHPWPRILSFLGAPVVRSRALTRIRQWSGEMPEEAVRRCGIGTATDDKGREAVVALALPVLAELSPLPAEARRGEWITVEALLRPGVDAPRVVLLGPRGLPLGVPASFRDGKLVARFHADHDGRWLVQVVADTERGPRPVVEGTVRVGGSDEAEDGVPGDDLVEGTPEATLAAMVRAARAAERVPRLTSSPSLDRLARAHAERMAKVGRLGHDVGDGDPVARLEAAGLEPAEVGENVAQGGTVAHAHRLIWASPSHRENLLSPRWRESGVGVARGANGRVWVVELFVR